MTKATKAQLEARVRELALELADAQDWRERVVDLSQRVLAAYAPVCWTDERMNAVHQLKAVLKED